MQRYHHELRDIRGACEAGPCKDYAVRILNDNNTMKFIPRLDQDNPFQNERNDDEPSTDRPAAKILLAFPLSTSTAVTGPGRPPEPMAVQLVLENVYWATFAAVLSDNAMEPDAMSCSSFA